MKGYCLKPFKPFVNDKISIYNMSDNSSRKARSFAELQTLIRSVRKFATDANTPEDPNQEPVPADKKEQITTPEERNLPTPQPTNKGEGDDAGANTELEQLEASEKEITPEKGENTEKELSVKAASLLSKIKGVASKAPQVKEANHNNIASDVSLSSSTLQKVASIMLSTEEGQRQVANAVAKARADGMKLASLNELININNMYKAQEAMQRKYASYNDVLNYHASEMDRLYANDQACKYAYAQGAEDANAMMAAQGAPAVPPEAMQAAPEANQNEAQQLVDMLVQGGMIDPNAAQQMVALAQQITGGQPMTPELVVAWIEQCAQQGIIPPEVAQQIVASLGGGEQAPAAPEADPTAPAPVADPAAQAKVAHIMDIAHRLLFATQAIKTAAAKDGAVDDANITPEDVDAVADVAVENGEISPEEADAATDLIAAGALQGGAADPANEEAELDALAEQLAAAGVTEEEVEAALQELAAEEGVGAEEVAGDPIDELVNELEAAGVSEEEVAQAIEELAAEEAAAAEGGDEEISDEEALALAQELENAGIDEETLAEAIAAATEGEQPVEGGDEEITEDDFEETEPESDEE